MVPMCSYFVENINSNWLYVPSRETYCGIGMTVTTQIFRGFQTEYSYDSQTTVRGNNLFWIILTLKICQCWHSDITKIQNDTLTTLTKKWKRKIQLLQKPLLLAFSSQTWMQNVTFVYFCWERELFSFFTIRRSSN